MRTHLWLATQVEQQTLHRNILQGCSPEALGKRGPALNKAGLAIWSHTEAQEIRMGTLGLQSCRSTELALRNGRHIVPFCVPVQGCFDTYFLLGEDPLHTGYVRFLHTTLVLQALGNHSDQSEPGAEQE